MVYVPNTTLYKYSPYFIIQQHVQYFLDDTA